MTQQLKNRSEQMKQRVKLINQGIVPEGYKKSQIGIIPKEWKVKKLGELGEVFRGKGISKSQITETGLPCIIYGELYTLYNNVITNLFSKINEETATNSFALQYGDILFTSSGETAEDIGKSAMYLNNDTAYAGGDMVILRPSNMIKNEVYGYLLNMSYIRKQKYQQGQGHSVVHLYGENIKSILVPIINKKEQQKIAEVLTTWGRIIELKEILIKSKKKYQIGLLENMLNQNLEWTSYRLGDVLSNRVETGHTDLELIAITSDQGVVKRSELDRKDTSSENKEKYKLVLPNDIAYNTMRMWQGVSGLSKYKGIVSPAYTVLIPDIQKICPIFTSYLFKTKPVINLFRRNSQGLVKDTWNLKYENFKKIKLDFPSLFEQQRIAEILSAADKEIELLKSEVLALKEQKKGLMQLLLTGIIRIGEDNHA